jgi:hypothetical protein
MKGRKHRASGGVNEAAEDAKQKGKSYTYDSNVETEAKARKRGGKTVAKHGEHAKHHAGRKPRKSGGRTGSNMNPLSSAASGKPAAGRNVSGSINDN